MGLNFYYYDGLQPEMRAGIINEHECSYGFFSFFLIIYQMLSMKFKSNIHKSLFIGKPQLFITLYLGISTEQFGISETKNNFCNDVIFGSF